MFGVQLCDGAVFSCDVDFGAGDFANLSFFDAARQDILFHLSLRAAEGMLVWNRRIADQWQDPVAQDLPYPAGQTRLEITFGTPQGALRLNGQRLDVRGDVVWPDPATLAAFDLQGAFVPESFNLTTGAAPETLPGRGEIALQDGCLLSGWGIDRLIDTQRFALRLAGQDGLATPEICALPDIAAREGLQNPWIGFRADLPGRVWRLVPPGADVPVQLYSNGRPCGAPLALTRAAVLAGIETLAPQLDFAADPVRATLVVEHVRFARLWPDLSPDAAEAVRRIAHFYRLNDFLWADEPASLPPPPARPDPEDDSSEEAMVRLAETARARFGQKLRSADATGANPDMAALLPEMIFLPQGALQLVCLWLAEVFCSADRFDDLWRFACDQGVADFEPGPHAWRNSAILPFLVAAGRLAEAARILSDIAPPQEGWRSVPAIAWVMRQTVSPPPGCGTPAALPMVERAVLLRPCLDFIGHRAGLYWDVAPNQQLVQALAQVIAGRALLPQDLAEQAEVTALRAYALTPEFWQALQGVALPPRLAQARMAFDTIRDHLEGRHLQGAALDGALRVMAAGGAADLPRLRRELFAPAGLASGQGMLAGLLPDRALPLARQLALLGEGADEALLRHLAFPGTEAPTDPGAAAELATGARAAVRRAYDILPASPHLPAQQAAAQAMAALIDALAALPAPERAARAAADLPAILPRLALLAQRSARLLGLGLAVTLADRLLRLGCTAAAETVCDHLAALRSALDAETLGVMNWNPALQSALFTLRQTRRALQPGAAARTADDLLALFPAAVGHLPRAFDGPAALPAAAAPALYDDTIVLVISCRPNLETRIPALRAAWADRLAAMGLRYLVVTGGAAPGQWQIAGDVLKLDAPDDYEGLPQKTLAAIAWVQAHTPFAHLIKIDDDCYLDAAEFFPALSWRKFHYYGRLLIRRPGQMDRSWHCTKSRSDRGRFELDRSPEPATYADGGSGYVLNRIGMAIVKHHVATPAGRTLIRHSMMEDKLVGDLLALSHVAPEEEDYLVSVRRRTHARAHPVPLWVNGFAPGRASGTRLVHLDTHDDQAASAAGRAGLLLRPPKIWPSHQRARLGYNTNLLELQSPEPKLARLSRAPLAVVSAMRNEMFLLPHFLAHYRRLGVGCFLIADNCSDDGTLEYLLDQPDVATFSVDSDYRISHYGVAWQQALLSHFRQGRWSLVADADELLLAEPAHATPAGGRRLETLLAGADFAAADAVRIRMLDMYPQGALSQVDFASGDPFAEAGFVERDPFLADWPGLGHYGNAPTWTSALRHRLIPGSRSELFVAQKVALVKYRPWMRFSAGLHYAAGVHLAPRDMIFAHFKYHAEFRHKAENEVRRRQHFNDAEEYARYLALMAEGREVIFDPAISVRWQDCAALAPFWGGRANPAPHPETASRP